MSKPNLPAFSSSVGIYRNKRMRDLDRLLSKWIPRKVAKEMHKRRVSAAMS